MGKRKCLNRLSDISDSCYVQQNPRCLTKWATEKFDIIDLYELEIDQLKIH